MLQRKIIQRLAEWRASSRKRALLINGARQVGKTTTIRMFASTHYKHFVEINFVKHPSAKKAFDNSLDTRSIVLNLSALGFGPFVKGETLVFFDEIQECPNARTAIKFLVEDGDYDYIESGSLLGINYKEITSYPVGFEEEIRLFPLDFEEFLWAKGISGDVIDYLRQCYDKQVPVSPIIHEQVSRCLREYIVVGGMPAVVQQFVEQDDFGKVVATQRAILTTYKTDISKYAEKDKILVNRVFDAIPAELGKQNKRFVLADIEKGAAQRKYSTPTQWLIDAGLAYYSFNTTALELPLTTTENRNLYKLYLVDTGLLCSLMLKNLQMEVMNGDISINEGALTENYTACCLASKEIMLHYYDHKSRQELDFVYANNGILNIVEVKSGGNYHIHHSLNAAIEKNGDKIDQAIVLCPGNIEVGEQVLYLPLYMAMFL